MQLKLDKDRKRFDKIVQESQERAYWRVYRPPPGFTTVVESSPVPTREQRIKARCLTREHLTEEVVQCNNIEEVYNSSTKKAAKQLPFRFLASPFPQSPNQLLQLMLTRRSLPSLSSPSPSSSFWHQRLSRAVADAVAPPPLPPTPPDMAFKAFPSPLSSFSFSYFGGLGFAAPTSKKRLSYIKRGKAGASRRREEGKAERKMNECNGKRRRKKPAEAFKDRGGHSYFLPPLTPQCRALLLSLSL